MRALLHLFPRRFRERYGPELVDLFEQTKTPWRDAADLVGSALCLHLDNALRAVRRWASGGRHILAVLVAAGAGVALNGSPGLGPALAIDGCSTLGATVLGTGSAAVVVLGWQLATRRMLWLTR